MTQGNLALVFPGQGCQFVGMGAELAAAYPEARALYERADEVLGLGLSELCFQGPEAELNDTANTQPAIYVSSMALWQVLAPRLGDVLPRVAFVAGHSLGEFVALAVAGAFSFEDGLKLVRCRGEAMRDAGVASPGGMVAIIGLDDAALAEVLAAGQCGWRTRRVGRQRQLAGAGGDRRGARGVGASHVAGQGTEGQARAASGRERGLSYAAYGCGRGTPGCGSAQYALPQALGARRQQRLGSAPGRAGGDPGGADEAVDLTGALGGIGARHGLCGSADHARSRTQVGGIGADQAHRARTSIRSP